MGLADSPSGAYRKIALTASELERMTPLQLAHHIHALSPTTITLLVAIFEYLQDKPDVRMGLLRSMGLLKSGEPTTPPTAPPETGS